MTLSIRHPKADRLAREISRDTGKPITTVVVEALQEYATRHSPESDKEARFRRLRDFLAEVDKLPVKDPRSAKEIMDDLYDENGLPK